MSMEARFGENMVRASVSADLGQHLHAVVKDPEHRVLLEETFVATAHDMFEAGQTAGRGQSLQQEGQAYLRGFFDAIKIITGEE